MTNEVKLTLNDPCSIMAKVAYFVFTINYLKDITFYTWPWNDIIKKSSYT